MTEFLMNLLENNNPEEVFILAPQFRDYSQNQAGVVSSAMGKLLDTIDPLTIGTDQDLILRSLDISSTHSSFPSINWDSFSLASDHSVNFTKSTASSVLNHVVGNSPTSIVASMGNIGNSITSLSSHGAVSMAHIPVDFSTIFSVREELKSISFGGTITIPVSTSSDFNPRDVSVEISTSSAIDFSVAIHKGNITIMDTSQANTLLDTTDNSFITTSIEGSSYSYSSIMDMNYVVTDTELLSVTLAINGVDSDTATIISGTESDDILSGAEGMDILSGDAGNDMLHGGFGSDILEGGTGADLLDGGAGIDYLDYGSSQMAVNVDLLLGSGTGGDAEGDQYVSIENVVGSLLNDTLHGDNENNLLVGWYGDDTLHGARGDDTLEGGEGNDIVRGGRGDDILTGGRGADILTGGAHRDHFVYNSIKDSIHDAYDIITDFLQGKDKIDLSALKSDGIKGFANVKVTQNTSTNHTILTTSDTLVDHGGQPIDFHVELVGNLALKESDFIFG
jgi:Ca2+-binding RTX toxin-like protein